MTTGSTSRPQVLCRKGLNDSKSKRQLQFETLEKRLLLAVFDFDSRIQVPDNRLRNPVELGDLSFIAAHSAVGQVVIDRDRNGDISNGDTNGSGFLVRPNYVMTAAHVVYSRNKEGQLLAASPDKMFIRFGWNGSTAFGGVVGVKRISMPPEWKDFVDNHPTHKQGLISPEATLFDYALLELDQNIKSKTLVSFYPDANTTAALVNLSDDFNPNIPTGTDHLFASGYPSDPYWRNLNYPQVITSGPARFNSSGAIQSAPQDYVWANPWAGLRPYLPRETLAAYNQRNQQYQQTSGLDTYKGMSGGPLWVWHDGSSVREEYQFVGIVSGDSSQGNTYVPVTNRMIADMNRWTGKVGSGIHFATEPADDVESKAIVSSYDDLFDTQENFAPNGVVGITDSVSADNYFVVSLPLYNRGSSPTSAMVDFYATRDDEVDPSTDMFLGSKEFYVEVQASGNSFDRYRLPVPLDFPHRTPFRLGWVITDHADPEGDRGLFPGSFSVDWAPTLRIDHDFTFSPGLFDLTGGDYIYSGETSKYLPVYVSDNGGNVDSVSLSAFTASDTSRSSGLDWVEFNGTGSQRTIRLSPPLDFSDEFIVVVATDDYGTTAGTYIPIAPPPSNYPPVVSRIPNVLIKEGEVFTYQIEATDRDGLESELKFGPSLYGIDELTGIIKIETDETMGGKSYDVYIQVTDAGVPSATSARKFRVDIEEVNEPPLIAPITKQVIPVGQELNLQIGASDTDIPIDVLTYSALDLPDGATFDANTQRFRWTPASHQGGVHAISFKVDDGATSVTSEVLIEVTGTKLWHNYTMPLDVTSDSFVSPVDALLIINMINAATTSILPQRTGTDEPFVDVNGDDLVTPIDALIVINYLNSPIADPEGEYGCKSENLSLADLQDRLKSVDDFFCLLFDDGWYEDSSSRNKRLRSAAELKG